MTGEKGRFLLGIFAFACLILCSRSTWSAPILLQAQTIDPSKDSIQANALKKSSTREQLKTKKETLIYIIQHDGVISSGWRDRLLVAGAKICRYIPENAYLIEMSDDVLKRVEAEIPYVYLGEYLPKHRLESSVSKVVAGDLVTLQEIQLQQQLADADETAVIYVISLFDSETRGDVVAKILQLPMCAVMSENGTVIRAKLTTDGIAIISRCAEVEWVEPYFSAQLSNNVAVQQPRMNVETVWPGGASGTGLTGAGQIVAVCDTGLDTGDQLTLHRDVRGRVSRAYARSDRGVWSDPHGHGTHVTGSVLGNGAESSGSIRGVAYEATLIFQSVLGSDGTLNSGDDSGGGLPADLNTLFLQAYNEDSGKAGARIHSNSWGTPKSAGCYTSNSRSVDQFAFEHPDMLIVFAAGNDGIDTSPADGIIDKGSLESPGTAKNCLTVGASENSRTTGGFSGYTWGQVSDFNYPPVSTDYISQSPKGKGQGMAAFSGRGPCKDGRVKPDVVAPGTDILSLKSSLADVPYNQLKYDSYYRYDLGTSMSTPLTSGAAALVRQWLNERRNIADPDAATVKALLMAGAKTLTPGQYGVGETREIPASYPNNVEGWGQVNLGDSLARSSSSPIIYDAQTIAQGMVNTYSLVFTSSASDVRILLAYADAPGGLQAAKQLVDDLDLEVVSPSGSVTYPNSGSSADRVNNSEGVRLDSVSSGTYTVRVIGYNIPSPMPASLTGGNGMIRYSLVVVGSPLTKTVRVSFDAQGGAVSSSNLCYTVNASYGCLPIPSKNGYAFDGWYTAVNGAGVKVDNATLVDVSITKVYAKWISVSTAVPDAPQNVSASITYDDKIQVYWASSNKVSSYKVYRATTLSGSKSYLGSSTTSPYDDKTANAGTVYYYWVTAANSSGESDYSAFATGYREYQSVTISFNGNGNSEGSAPTPISARQKSTIVLPSQGTLAKAGYLFVGWCSSSSGTGATNFPGTSYSVPLASQTLFALWRESASPSSDFEYSLYQGEITIERYTGSDKQIFIPSTIDGYPVRCIGYNAFKYCDATSITIPSSVISIEDSAFCCCQSLVSLKISSGVKTIGESAFFWCTSLTTLAIPSSVTQIYDEAFYGCESLRSVTIPSSVEMIGDKAFNGCVALNSLTLSVGLMSIGAEAFSECDSLPSVAIPEGVTTVGISAFAGCDSLATATIPSSLKCVPESGFRECNALSTVTLRSGVTNIGFCAFQDCNSLTSISIPSTVTVIEEGAFGGCSSLPALTLPSGVTRIEREAFWGCDSLTSVFIPRNVCDMGTDVFGGCGSLTSISVDTYNPFFSGLDGLLFNKEKSILLQCPGGKTGALTIPSGVAIIGESSFYCCSLLRSITLPTGITSIKGGAFYGCDSLRSINIPSGVTNIGGSAFYDCDALRSISIPSSVISLGDAAFMECGSLSSVSIGSGVKNIGMSTFSGCKSLDSIAIPSSVTDIGSYAFEGCTVLRLVTIPNGVKTIGAGAFFRCLSLTDLSIPSSVTWIAPGAFSYCSSLTAISVDENNPTYSSRDGVLYGETIQPPFDPAIHLVQYPAGRSGLFTTPSDVSRIDDGAFAGCNLLPDIAVSANVRWIDAGAFSDCRSLTNVTFQTGLKNLGYNFSGCDALTELFIPSSVNYLGGINAGELTTITVDTDNQAYCSLEGVLYNKAKTILKQCPSGKAGSFIVPASVTNITSDAFENCNALSGVYFLGNKPAVDWDFTAEGFSVYSILQTKGWGYAPWELGRCPIYVWTTTATFESNGGESPSYSSYSYCVSNAYDRLPTISRDGYTFAGWYTDAITGTPVTAKTLVPLYTSEHTLYAHWTANTYAVTFDAQSGSLDPTTPRSTVTYDAAYGELPVALRMGYTFEGWWTSTNGLGSQVVSSTVVKTAQNHTLYAKWVPSTYTVALDAQGGTLTNPLITVTYAVTYGTLPIPSRRGFAFDGWWTGTNGIGTRITADTRVTTPSDHCLYANWIANVQPIITSRSPIDPVISVKETSSVAFRVVANDSADPNAATRGMSNISWYVNGSLRQESQTGAPDAITSAFTLKTDNILGVTASVIQIRVVAQDVVGGMVETNWTVQVNNIAGAQSITFKALPVKVFGDDDFDASASASSGLTVTYTSSNESVATISNGKIHIVGAGTAVIIASQSGSADWITARPVSQTLTVKSRLTTGTPSGGGIVSGAGLYLPGAKVSLTAKPDNGYTFLCWDDGYQETRRDLIMPSTNIMVSASFGLTTNVPPPTVSDLGSQKAMVGLSFRITLDIQSSSQPKVTVSGLPAGLAYMSATKTIQGVPTASVTNKTVTVSASNVNKIPTVKTFTITVAPLPIWAQGTFNGYAEVDGLDAGGASLSVTALGAASGKFTLRGTNFAFSAAGYTSYGDDGVFRLNVTSKVANASVPLSLAVSLPEIADETGSVPAMLSRTAGTIGGDVGAVSLWRNVWKDAGMAAMATNYTGYYTATLLGGDGYGSGYLAFTVDKAGNVKTAGKLADGTAVSLSGTLILDEGGRAFAVLYTAPAAYKGGGLFGVAEFVKPDAGPVAVRLLDAPFLWNSFNPQATGEYGVGFSHELGISGGWYNSVINLRDYYENGLTVGGVELPSLTATVRVTDWDDTSTRKVTQSVTDVFDAAGDASPNGVVLGVTPATGAGTGLSAPKSDAPVKDTETGAYIYADTTGDGVNNTSGLTLRFTRATGLFTGTFKAWYDYVSASDLTVDTETWTHTSKSVTYQGALTPVRDSGDAEGRGFFLWADKGAYENTAGKTVTYGFNASYDFLLLGL